MANCWIRAVTSAMPFRYPFCRILANVFNVSIQSFSDVVDLEAFEDLKPEIGEPQDLLNEGLTSLQAGNNGQAFAYFERVIELLGDDPTAEHRETLLGRARINQASALARLGKLSLAEQELRNALRNADRLTPTLRARALLALANIHADQGDGFLSEIEAEKADRLAREESLDLLAAMAVHTQARVLSDRRDHEKAIEKFREASQLYIKCDEHYESIRVRINIAACFVALGKAREGVRMLRSSVNESRAGRHRRLESFAWRSLGFAYYQMQDAKRAKGCFRESNALAVYNNEKQPDILFFNAYYEWKMAAEGGNPTREKIAFGRLKILRSSLERKFAEVEAFDEFVEKGRRDA